MRHFLIHTRQLTSEYKDIMDIADILVVILCYSSIVLSMKMSPCEKWSRTGITAAGTGVASSLDNKLNLPSSISIHN
jgi:hypothetical protein